MERTTWPLPTPTTTLTSSAEGGFQRSVTPCSCAVTHTDAPFPNHQAQKGGIGAGVSIAGLLLLGGLAAFFYRKKEAGKASSAAHGAHSIDGRTLHGDNSSFASRDMAQKVAA